MTALALTPDTRVMVVQLAIVAAMAVVFIVIGVAIAPKTHIAPPPLLAVDETDDETEDDGLVDCPRCGGMGVYDIEDYDGRPFIRDAECPRCDGIGRVDGAWL